jgi:hypothetical protein
MVRQAATCDEAHGLSLRSPLGNGETQCLKVRSDEVVDGPSLRSQAVAGHAVLPIAEAAGSLSFAYSSSGSGSPLAEGMP